jgi:glucose/arabinose dehydrogenase
MLSARFLSWSSLTCCMLAPFIARADDQPVVLPAEYLCYFTENPPTIDGRANEPAWQLAKPIGDFKMPWIREGSDQPQTATRAKLLWDREYVYFFADMDDHDLFADVKEHDGKIWTNDVFELFFKPTDDKTGYYEFQVNAANAKLDVFYPLRTDDGFERHKANGDFELTTAVQLAGTLNKHDDKDTGWTCEGRIAWKDFSRTGGRPLPDERWKFTLCRYDYTSGTPRPELSCSAPLKTKARPDFHHYEDYATIRFVASKDSPRPQAAKPFGLDQLAKLTTSRVFGSPDPPKPYNVERIFDKLPLMAPVTFRQQPGGEFVWIATQRLSYKPTTLFRFRNTPDVAELEMLLPPDKDQMIYDLRFHPRFMENGYVFIGSNGSFGGEQRRTRVTRYHVDRKPPHKFDADSATVIIEWDSAGHDGAALAFGPDGMLYVTSGDGTSDSDQNLAGQDLSRLTCKLLRIDVDHVEPGQLYRVPPDNPFVDQNGVRPETYAYGFRNPWRLEIDSRNGQIWIGNNGQDLWESIYLVERGANYGWSIFEGSHAFYPDRKQGPHPVSKPIADHSHSEARSLTGGLVSHSKKLADLEGAYLYGDYSTGKIWAIKHDGQKIVRHEEIADTPLQITAFAEGNEDDIWLLDHGGHAIYRLVPSSTDRPPATFPTKLSESGLFKNVSRHAVAAGVIPYSVNSPLWSDGAYKERFLAIPFKEGEDCRIDFKDTRGWGFPNDTVLIKSFALEQTAGDAASRRWIETRFLVRQQNEWVGYSYEWNHEQTDALLVASGGRDREFEIRDPSAPGGVRKQSWHYPSRTECMLCHSRAANFVLGLQTVQMNREHDYGGTIDNQLRAFEHAGLFRINWGGENYAFHRNRFVEQQRKEAGEKASDPDVQEDINRRAEAYLSATLFAPDQRVTPKYSDMFYRDPSTYSAITNPYDTSAPVASRARSYLHANCSHCHVPAGGGNAKMDLSIETPLAGMSLIDQKPQHHTYGLPDGRLVFSGNPAQSILLHRVGLRGPGQMPQLATSIVDQNAVTLLQAWIAGLPQKHGDR